MIIKKLGLFMAVMFYHLLVYASDASSLKPRVGGTRALITAKKSESLGDIASNIFGFGQDMEKVVKTVVITSGAAIVLFGIMQYGKYRKNPIETPLSKVIMTITVGLSLIGLAFIPMKF